MCVLLMHARLVGGWVLTSPRLGKPHPPTVHPLYALALREQGRLVGWWQVGMA